METAARMLENLVSFFLSTRGWFALIVLGTALGFVVEPSTVLIIVSTFAVFLIVVDRKFDIGGAIILSAFFIIAFMFIPMAITSVFIAVERVAPASLVGLP